MDSSIEEIKSRLDIIELIGQYIKLRKTGVNFSALCPFHSEKTGSFFISPARQTWKCFGCGKGGDIFTFVQEIEGVEFGDALRILAAKAGVELKKRAPQIDQKLKTQRQRIYDLCELAAKFFEKQLKASARGQAAKKYLLDRGISEKSILEWRLGYAPETWQGLRDFLASEGYTDEEIIGAGLVVSNDRGRVYDRFRGRIIFPIFDFNSQIVGFGGRIFENRNENGSPPPSPQGGTMVSEAKYLNTANTLLYDKSRILYGLDRAKVAIRRQNRCVLVEGYTDVIMSAQAEVGNVVASSGTALTETQLKILKRFTDNLVLGYDMDLAGDSANRRAIDLALSLGFNVSVARPPFEGKDPADVIALDPREWQKTVASPKTIMEFYFERAFAAGDKETAPGRKKIVEFILPAIKIIPNAVEQAFWLQKLADRLETRDIHYEDYLRQELKKVKLNPYPEVKTTENLSPKTALTPEKQLEKRILVLAIKYPQAAGSIDESLLDFFSAGAKEIIKNLKNDPVWHGRDLEGKDKEFYESLALEAESEIIDQKAAFDEIEFHICRINNILFKNSTVRLLRAIRAAEKCGDNQTTARLRHELNSLLGSTQNKS